MKKFEIIRDTREKVGQGWNFDHYSECLGTCIEKIDIGDYAVRGLEHLLCIERKASVSEFAGNCTEKRFIRELEAMSKFPHKFLIFEFSIWDILRFPEGSNIPKRKWQYLKIKGNYMMTFISGIAMKYGIHVIPCGDSETAERTVFSLMKRVVKDNEELL